MLCAVIQTLTFALHGLTVWLLIRFAFQVPDAPLWSLTGIFATAWVAGFVTPGAPAGVGVREAALTVGLTPICGAGTHSSGNIRS